MNIQRYLPWIKTAHMKIRDGSHSLLLKWGYSSRKVDPNGKAVLITGCDNGLGNILARKLDTRGFKVFASCLQPSGTGATELKKHSSKNLQVFKLDVRKDESVKEALDFVRNNLGKTKLWAVVNNAGIQRGFSLDFTSMDDFKECIEVNALGVVRMSKTFLPLLREYEGRIVNLTSILGRIAVPHGSPYVMSKFAVAGFNDSMRQELNEWGVQVISIEPELFATELTSCKSMGRSIESAMASADDTITQLYGENYLPELKKYVDSYTSYATPKIYKIMDALEAAVMLEHPWPAYRPCRNELIRVLIWDYELKMHINRDLITRFFLYMTGFPKPRKAIRKEYSSPQVHKISSPVLTRSAK